jgi:hypothetical protein
MEEIAQWPLKRAESSASDVLYAPAFALHGMVVYGLRRDSI